jgi:hypothetical protein
MLRTMLRRTTLNGTGRNARDEWGDIALNDIQVTRTNLDGRNADARDIVLDSISNIRTSGIVGH